MAGRDYVLCANCGVKVFYDGSQAIRDSLEERWGDPSAPDFTVHMICPECLKKQEDEIERLRRLLSEALDSEISDYWYVRVREALGHE